VFSSDGCVRTGHVDLLVRPVRRSVSDGRALPHVFARTGTDRQRRFAAFVAVQEFRGPAGGVGGPVVQGGGAPAGLTSEAKDTPLRQEKTTA
jgi:hypothetical protein